VILALARPILREAAFRCSALATERAFVLEIFFVVGIVTPNSSTGQLPNVAVQPRGAATSAATAC
jgi:hypothetical protein